MTKLRTCIVSCMKNEGPYILDWIAYHKMIGVTDFLIYANDCDDRTFQILLELHRMRIIEFRFNHVLPRRGVQKSALWWAASEPIVAEADWLMMLDVDEYINIHIGNRMLKDLYEKHAAADAISLVWRRFGHAGVVEISDTPVPLEFSQAETSQVTAHRFFKTVFRNNGKFERMGVHRPYLEWDPKDINWVLPNGEFVPEDEMPGILHVRENYGYETAQINHYALRSMDAFLGKKVRGRANHMSGKMGLGYWMKFDHNEERDESLHPLMKKAVVIKSTYLRESYILSDLVKESREIHRNLAKKIRSRDWGQDFVKQIQEFVDSKKFPDDIKRTG